MRLFKHTNYFAATLLAGVIFAGCTKDSHAPQPTTTKTAATTTTTDEMVVTPAGLMPRSHTHFIEPGTELQVSNEGHLQKVDAATRNVLQDFGPVTTTQDPIHQSAPFADLNSVFPAAVNGWAAYTYWSNPTTTKPITSFSTSWTVPAVPATQGKQTIFLFNGLQDGETASSYIIQPVLQWGSSAAGSRRRQILGRYQLVCFQRKCLLRHT
jgi:hypothetical protein